MGAICIACFLQKCCRCILTAAAACFSGAAVHQSPSEPHAGKLQMLCAVKKKTLVPRNHGCWCEGTIATPSRQLAACRCIQLIHCTTRREGVAQVSRCLFSPAQLLMQQAPHPQQANRQEGRQAASSQQSATFPHSPNSLLSSGTRPTMCQSSFLRTPTAFSFHPARPSLAGSRRDSSKRTSSSCPEWAPEARGITSAAWLQQCRGARVQRQCQWEQDNLEAGRGRTGQARHSSGSICVAGLVWAPPSSPNCHEHSDRHPPAL